jgi:hypothetical protein
MTEISNGVVVTEEMITEAAEAGDLEQLQEWGRQGVCVRTADPLVGAATRFDGGSLEVLLCLVRELGADVDQAYGRLDGPTPLTCAAEVGDLSVVQCLVQLGADVNRVDFEGYTPLLMAAEFGNLAVVRFLFEAGAGVGAVGDLRDTAVLASAANGRFETMQYLLEEGGAMDHVSDDGGTVWDMLIRHFRAIPLGDDDEAGTDVAALTSLLRVMVLRGAPPPALAALLSPEPARVVQECARLRARLPAYLVQRRVLLDEHCPLLLPPLRALVHDYIELTTTDEIWATGLGTAL